MNDTFLKEFGDLCVKHGLRITRAEFNGVTGPDGPKPRPRFTAVYHFNNE